MASYLNKEISEWNTTDLCNWLLANKFRGISELCQKYSLSGYDLFFINDDILKNELGLKSFHERNVALKLFTKLTYEHLRLNVINSNGDNVILTLDNDQETKLGELADYIGNMFNINPKDILFKDSTKQEVLSPTVKIVRMLILYPKIYKTLNVSNMKDYHQAEEDMMESGDYQEENNNNNNTKIKMDKNYKKEQQDFYSGSMDSDMLASGGMDLQNVANTKKMYNNNYNYNMQNNNNKNNYRKMKVRENEQRNNLRQQNNEYMNYKYNNQDKINKNNKVNMNRDRDNNYEDQINNENNMNRMNMNGNDNNLDYNDEYQENIGKQYKNEDRPYIDQNERKRQNYQYQGGNNKIINYNEESNFGLMSSGNDDEMKFKPSYQIKNSDFDENKQNFENNDNENDNDNDN